MRTFAVAFRNKTIARYDVEACQRRGSWLKLLVISWRFRFVATSKPNIGQAVNNRLILKQMFRGSILQGLICGLELRG